MVCILTIRIVWWDQSYITRFSLPRGCHCTGGWGRSTRSPGRRGGPRTPRPCSPCPSTQWSWSRTCSSSWQISTACDDSHWPDSGGMSWSRGLFQTWLAAEWPLRAGLPPEPQETHMYQSLTILCWWLTYCPWGWDWTGGWFPMFQCLGKGGYFPPEIINWIN